MIETQMIEYLAASVGVPVFAEAQAGVPEYVLIQKIDGETTDQIRQATLNIYATSMSLQKSAELSEAVRRAALGAVALPNISHASVGDERASFDTTNKKYRYNIVLNLTYFE